MNKVNVYEALIELNKEISSTKLEFSELNEIEVRDLIITKLLLQTKNPEFDESHEELLKSLESTANFMRGMAMDMSLSIAQRESLTQRVHDIDELTESFNEAY